MFTIKTVLDFAKKNPDFKVGFYVEDYGSWRGVYSEPCLFVDLTYESDEDATVDKLILPLEDLISGKEFFGFKGGTYIYYESNTLHLEQSPRDYSGYSSLWDKPDMQIFKKALEVFEFLQNNEINT